jgi:hypothetical protein
LKSKVLILLAFACALAPAGSTLRGCDAAGRTAARLQPGVDAAGLHDRFGRLPAHARVLKAD